MDAYIAGGITERRRVAAAANFYAVGMVHHEEPQVAIHLLIAIPYNFCAELFQDPVRDPVWHECIWDHPQAKTGPMSWKNRLRHRAESPAKMRRPSFWKPAIGY